MALELGFHPLQKMVFDDPHRFKILDCGRRWGKTRLASYVCIIMGMSHKNGEIILVSPTFSQTQIIFNMILKFLPVEYIKSKSVAEKYVELISGTRIYAKSGDNPDSMRGYGPFLAILDEAAMLKEEVWREVLRPALADNKGSAFVISTPRGSNYFRELFRMGQSDDPQYSDYVSFQFSSYDNPFLDPKELDEMAMNLPEIIYKQEILGEFIEGGGVVFRTFTEVLKDCLDTPESDEDYVGGADLGRREDFTVISIMKRRTREIVYLERFNKLDWDYIKSRVTSVSKQYNNATIFLDSTGMGDPIYEDLAKQGVNVRGVKISSSSKPTMINALSIMIENKQIWLPNDTELKKEFQSYTYTLTPEGNVKYGAPCFLPGTWVLGEQPKQIEEYIADDSVISGMGISRRATPVVTEYDGDVVSLKVVGEPERLQMTPNHMVLTMKRHPQDLQKWKDRKEIPPVWIPASELKPKDRVFVPKRKNLPHADIPDDLLYLMGHYLANGCIHKDPGSSSQAVNITMNRRDEYILHQLKDTFERYFPKKAYVKCSGYTNMNGTVIAPYIKATENKPNWSIKVRRENTADLNYCSTDAAEFLTWFCSQMSYGKKLQTEFFNSSNLLPLLCGWIDGDGHQRKDQQHDITIVTVSNILARQMKQVCIDNGIFATLVSKQRGEHRLQWILNIKCRYVPKLSFCQKLKEHEHERLLYARESDEGFWVPIKDITHKHYTGPVYNFHVDDDNTYTANGIVVHNCGMHDDIVMSIALLAYGVHCYTECIGMIEPEPVEEESYWNEDEENFIDWEEDVERIDDAPQPKWKPLGFRNLARDES